MNIPYLLKTIEVTKLSELVAIMEMTPLEMNLALWDSIAAGEIEVDEKNDKVKLLVEAEPWHNPELTNLLLRTVQHYCDNNTNITRGRMNAVIKDPITKVGFKDHEYVMSMQYLVDSGTVVEDIISVPKTKTRPYHKFVFIGLPANGEKNQEWNAAAVNKWIDGFEKSKVK